MTKEVTK